LWGPSSFLYNRYKAGENPSFLGPEAYTIFGAPFKKEKDYKIRYESKYFFRMRKEITNNY